MNFLAHAYLSFNVPHLLVGNMISDYVKGKKKLDYLPGIQKGISLHRAIDSFTDEHEITSEIKKMFREHYRLYSGAFIDVVYDHFLANDRAVFSNENVLKEFTLDTYKILGDFDDHMPGTFREFFPYMKQHNWLFNYRYDWGIQRSFAGLKHRALYINETETAFNIFLENKTELEKAYAEFFPLLKNYAHNLATQLMDDD